MLIAFIAISAVAVAIFYQAVRGANSTPKQIVDIVGAIDGRTVEVMINGAKERVILAGIGFPPGDQRSESECEEVVQEVVMGRRLYMEVHKDVGGCKYVTLSSSNGDCLNAMMLSKGLARYESISVGYVGNLVEAENQARLAGIGIWDKNRALFRHLSQKSESENDAYLESDPLDEYAYGRDD